VHGDIESSTCESRAASRNLETARDSLTGGCAARILGEVLLDQNESGERTSQGQIEMALDD
jgi:hypothetical protein